MKTLLQKTQLLILVAMLAACGFHMRGGVSLPEIMQITYVESEFPFDDMSRMMTQELRHSEVEVTQQKEAATAILRLIHHHSNRRVLSVGSSGRATEYELFEEVTFALSDAQGKEIIAPQTLNMSQDFVFDEAQLLGMVEEADKIKNQMQQTLARQILTRIQARFGNL